MHGWMRRVFARHGNALGFWAMAALIGLALAMAVALIRSRLG